MSSKDWVADWLDNPIFLKHVRSRLRRQPLFSAMVITLVLCFCVVWGGFALNGFISGGAFGTLLALQVIVLAIIGATQVGTSVGAARASGILDFHRVSPLTSTELALGFFFGAPVREYLLFAVTLPFSILCVAIGTPDFRGFLQVMILLLFSSWLIHGFSLINGLVLKKQAGSRGVVGLVLFLGLMSSSFWPMFGNVANWLDSDPRLTFFGISLPWLAVILLYQLPVLYFVFLASRRKFESERLHPFSKPQAIAAMAVLGVLIVGGTWNLPDLEPLAIVVLYVLVLVGIVLAAMVTPTQAEYYKGLWRAHKQGASRLSLWDDLSLNRPFLVVVCGIVLVAATIASARIRGTSSGLVSPVRDAYPLAIANGVLILAYHGLALQFFQLRFGRRGVNYLSLFLFLVWVLPLIAGTIYTLANIRPDSKPQVIFALSPIAGLGLTAAVTAEASASSDYMAVAGAAITPSLLFAFVFNGLVTAARRRIRKGVLLAIEKSRQIDPANVALG
jgi:hypothetical protein